MACWLTSVGPGAHETDAERAVRAALELVEAGTLLELHSHHFDSTIWNEFDFRDDDIIIAT
jgi:hypothetical protein